MILSMPFPGSSSKKTGQTKGENVSLWEKNSSGDGQQTEENIVQEPVQAASAKPAQDYEKELEDRISQLLKSVEGVGKVDVMVVLSSSSEISLTFLFKVFRTDRSENTSTTKEKDASGGERDAVSSQLEENTVFSQSAGQNTGNGPLIEKELYPQISGIVISAQGGDLPSVQAEISQAMQALFGLEPHKIKVLKRVE